MIGKHIDCKEQNIKGDPSKGVVLGGDVEAGRSIYGKKKILIRFYMRQKSKQVKGNKGHPLDKFNGLNMTFPHTSHEEKGSSIKQCWEVVVSNCDQPGMP